MKPKDIVSCMYRQDHCCILLCIEMITIFWLISISYEKPLIFKPVIGWNCLLEGTCIKKLTQQSFTCEPFDSKFAKNSCHLIPRTLWNWNQDHLLLQIIRAIEQSPFSKCSSRCGNAKFLTKKEHW